MADEETQEYDKEWQVGKDKGFYGYPHIAPEPQAFNPDKIAPIWTIDKDFYGIIRPVNTPVPVVFDPDKIYPIWRIKPKEFEGYPHPVKPVNYEEEPEPEPPTPEPEPEPQPEPEPEPEPISCLLSTYFLEAPKENKRPIIWQILLRAIHNEQSFLENDRWGIRYELIPDDESDKWNVAKRSNILPISPIGIFLNNFEVSTTAGDRYLKDFWNVSFQRTFNAFSNFLSNYKNAEFPLIEENKRITNVNGSINVTSESLEKDKITPFRVTDTLDADAGRSFVTEDKIYDENGQVVNPWVKQWYNVDEDSYRNVRGEDRNESVLSDDFKLQFSRNDKLRTIEKWMRLLLPSYHRAVEVEDLNRNFWVIAQTLTTISAHLFDKNSPINLVIKNLVGEINQLWENALYLWAGYAALTQEPIIDRVHTEIVYVWNTNKANFTELNDDDKAGNILATTVSSYTRFDGFNEHCDVDELISFYLHSYMKTNVVLIPIVRAAPYENNYYSKITIPDIYVINRNKKDHPVTSVLNGDWEYGKTIQTKAEKHSGGTIDINDLVDYLYGITESEDKYSGVALSSQKNSNGESEDKPFGLVDIDVKFMENGQEKDPYYDKERNEIVLGTPTIYIKDVAKELLKVPSKWIKYLEFNKDTDCLLCKSELSEADKLSNGIKMNATIDRGFYRGELLSSYGKNTAAAAR